jgi:hypothetical protein
MTLNDAATRGSTNTSRPVAVGDVVITAVGYHARVVALFERRGQENIIATVRYFTGPNIGVELDLPVRFLRPYSLRGVA